ncbi:ClpP protein [Tenacibaculum phage Larrie]|nr:ClpP protein [Tenacibaculum phage Larrie]
MNIYEKIKKAELETNTNLTHEQRESGEYQKGKVNIFGITVCIENPKDSHRVGLNEDGSEWKIKMNNTYGFIENTIGADGEEIDIFLGDKLDVVNKVFIINQNDKNGDFDEEKVMFGFESEKDAKESYLSNYEKGWSRIGSIDTVSYLDFIKMIFASNNKSKSLKMEERIKTVKLHGEVLENETLESLRSQAGSPESFDTLIVDIRSQGGDVDEGFSIMVWLEELRGMGKKVITIVSANSYSIASLIMLVADVRIISVHGEIMVHNPMFSKLDLDYVNADDLEEYIQELRFLEEIMFELYSEFTGTSIDKVRELMKAETYLSPEKALELGFVHEIVELEKKKYSMKQVKQCKIINMKTALNAINRFAAKMNGSKIVNQVYYNDKGGAIEIFQNELSTYQEGDKTSLENGEVTLSDGSKLVIEDYVIKQIIKEMPAGEGDETPPAGGEGDETPPPAGGEGDETPPPAGGEGDEDKKVVSMDDYNALVGKIDSLQKTVEMLMEGDIKKVEELTDLVNSSIDKTEKFEKEVTAAFVALGDIPVSNFRPKGKETPKTSALAVNDTPFGKALREAGLKQ